MFVPRSLGGVDQLSTLRPPAYCYISQTMSISLKPKYRARLGPVSSAEDIATTQAAFRSFLGRAEDDDRITVGNQPYPGESDDESCVLELDPRSDLKFDTREKQTTPLECSAESILAFKSTSGPKGDWVLTGGNGSRKIRVFKEGTLVWRDKAGLLKWPADDKARTRSRKTVIVIPDALDSTVCPHGEIWQGGPSLLERPIILDEDHVDRKDRWAEQDTARNRTTADENSQSTTQAVATKQ
jgi:hypothetical protein